MHGDRCGSILGNDCHFYPANTQTRCIPCCIPSLCDLERCEYLLEQRSREDVCACIDMVSVILICPHFVGSLHHQTSTARWTASLCLGRLYRLCKRDLQFPQRVSFL